MLWKNSTMLFTLTETAVNLVTPWWKNNPSLASLQRQENQDIWFSPIGHRQATKNMEGYYTLIYPEYASYMLFS